MEVIGCRNEGGWRVVEKNEGVGALPAMVDDDDRAVTCSPTESIEGGRLQEVVKDRQGLNLRIKAVPVVQKLLFLRLKTTKQINILRVFASRFKIVVVRYQR